MERERATIRQETGWLKGHDWKHCLETLMDNIMGKGPRRNKSQVLGPALLDTCSSGQHDI